MSKLLPYLRRGFEMFDTALDKTVGRYIVRPFENYVVTPGLDLGYKGARRIYYLYDPKARTFNRMTEHNVKKLKNYAPSLWVAKYKTPRNLATTRRILNIVPMSSTKCRIGRTQIGGTCWFQAIMNGWLLSDGGRVFLKARLDAYKRYKDTKKLNTTSCPRRKFDPDFFFSYLDSYFKENKNWNQQTYKNVNLIANLSLEQGNKAKGLEGGSETYQSKNMKNFMKNIFVTNWGYEPNKDVYLSNKVKPVPGYRLNHCIMAMAAEKDSGHAVTGYFCNGKPVVFDSNARNYLDIDWRTERGRNQLKRYYASMYKDGYIGPGNENRNIRFSYDTVVYLRSKPRFLNDPYFAPSLNIMDLSNKRLADLTGFNNRTLAVESIQRKIEGITTRTSLNILRRIYKRKFKENAPLIINSMTLYHRIKGIPYNGKLEYEYNLRNVYNIKHLNQFLVNLYGRTNNRLSKNNKKKILESFAYNTPWYNEASINLWRKAYKLKFGTNAPKNLNTNKKLYNAYTKND